MFSFRSESALECLIRSVIKLLRPYHAFGATSLVCVPQNSIVRSGPKELNGVQKFGNTDHTLHWHVEEEVQRLEKVVEFHIFLKTTTLK